MSVKYFDGQTGRILDSAYDAPEIDDLIVQSHRLAALSDQGLKVAESGSAKPAQEIAQPRGRQNLAKRAEQDKDHKRGSVPKAPKEPVSSGASEVRRFNTGTEVVPAGEKVAKKGSGKKSSRTKK